MQTDTLKARDELFVCAEVFRKIDADEAVLPSEAVVASNVLPVVASFLSNCEGDRDFKRVAAHLRRVAETCSRLAITNGDSNLIRSYP